MQAYKLRKPLLVRHGVQVYALARARFAVAYRKLAVFSIYVGIVGRVQGIEVGGKFAVLRTLLRGVVAYRGIVEHYSAVLQVGDCGDAVPEAEAREYERRAAEHGNYCEHHILFIAEYVADGGLPAEGYVFPDRGAAL